MVEMETIGITLWRFIILTASIVAVATTVFFICYLFFRLFQLFPTGLADKIGAVLDNLLMVVFGMFALGVFFVVCYQVGMDFLR